MENSIKAVSPLDLQSAKWIWPESDSKRKNSFAEFRKIWTIENKREPALFHISARNEYVLSINGRLVGRGPSPCDPMWQYYDTYDVSDRLAQGKNIISIVCYHFGENDIMTHQMQGKAGLIAQLEYGNTVELQTDSSWKCRFSPRWGNKAERISNWGGYKEIYIAGEEDGWETLTYNDESWNDAVVIVPVEAETGSSPRMIPREIPFLHKEIIRPRSVVRTEMNFGTIANEDVLFDESSSECMIIDATRPGSLPGVVFDFERGVVGWPRFEIDAPQGGVLRVAYGETLEMQYVDTFILKAGTNELKPFARRACRFMQLTFAATPQPIVVKKLDFEFTHYAYQQTGRFECSDPILNRIWETSKYTTLMNSHDHLEDCPWREKALWVVDAVVMGKVIYNTFGEPRLLRKCLQQSARIQNEDSSIPGTGPEKNPFLLPDFCAYWVLGVFDYWKYTGETEFVRQLWPNLIKVVGWFEAQTDETGLFSRADREGWWCFIDWTEDVDKRDKVAAISFLYYKVLKSAAEMAIALGIEDAAKNITERSDRLLQDIRRQFWIAEKQLFSDCISGQELSMNVSLQTNFLSIWCGIMSDNEAQFFLKEVYDRQLLPPVKGPFFQHIVLEVLLSKGRKPQALELIRGFWGEMIARGAATWWETFDASTPRCTIPSTYQGNTPTHLWEGVPISLCHAWGASPAYILSRMVLGADVSNLGEELLLLSNPLNSLQWARGEIPTKWGMIRIEWSSMDGTLSGIVRLPENIRVVAPPDYPLSIVTT